MFRTRHRTATTVTVAALGAKGHFGTPIAVSTNRSGYAMNVDANNERTSPFTGSNGKVVAFLYDVAGRPVPRGARTRRADIRQAVAASSAVVDMALDFIDIFPNSTPPGSGRRGWGRRGSHSCAISRDLAVWP
jgi:hypothetical protein